MAGQNVTATRGSEARKSMEGLGRGQQPLGKKDKKQETVEYGRAPVGGGGRASKVSAGEKMHAHGLFAVYRIAVPDGEADLP